MKEKVPGFEELQKKIGEFVNSLKKEYGSGIQDVKFGIYPEAQTEKDDGPERQNKDKKEFNIQFDLKPKEVKAYLDKYVIKQDEAKKILAIAVCDHYNHVSECIRQERESKNPKSHSDYLEEYTKQNVILIGPTGVGKTYLIKTLARLIGVPFVKADATKFSETGYVGGNVEDMVRELVDQADGNVELAQYGMIYIDEIDKIAVANNIVGRDVSGRGVQNGLLKLMEETEVDLTTPYDPLSQMKAIMEFQRRGKVDKKTISTKHILFFVSGAFNGLEDIIKERLQKQGIGFGAEVTSKKVKFDYMKECKSMDLIKFGFEPEFVGRLPVRTNCYELSSEDLFNILKYSEGSIIKQYKKAFKAYGIDVIFSDEGLQRIAEKAYEEKTGARALATISERVMRDFKYELPSTDIKSFIVTKELVDNPAEELKKLLSDPNTSRRLIDRELLKQYEQTFMDRHNIKITFTEDAINLISDRAIAEKTNVISICDRILGDYEYGLNLIKRSTSKSEFEITKDVVEDPSGTLDRWVKKYYTYQPENA